MNIHRVSAMPSISENPITWEASSQEARQEGSWHNSDAAANVIYAARIEHAVRNMTELQRPLERATPPPVQIDAHRQTWKKICHSLSMACGVAILPSFAFLALGPVGLIAPACLTACFIIFALLGGKPTEKMQQARALRAVEVSEFDFRQS